MRRPKKFRYQLLAAWLLENHQPCRAADIGGGRGLLTMLLNRAGWDSVVIDPGEIGKLSRYRDPDSGQQVKLSREVVESVPRLPIPFEVDLARDFDLMIGLHAHGTNMKVIDAAVKHSKEFILFPCCVIDEPIERRPNVDWLESLVEYARSQGEEISRVELGFRGQNIGILNWNPARPTARCI